MVNRAVTGSTTFPVVANASRPRQQSASARSGCSGRPGVQPRKWRRDPVEAPPGRHARRVDCQVPRRVEELSRAKVPAQEENRFVRQLRDIERPLLLPPPCARRDRQSVERPGAFDERPGVRDHVAAAGKEVLARRGQLNPPADAIEETQATIAIEPAKGLPLISRWERPWLVSSSVCFGALRAP
jgi:hypothetical protein